MKNFLLQWVRQHFHNTSRALGRIGSPTKSPKMLSAYVSGPLPPAPASWQPFKYMNWGMFGNGRYGDCTFAAAAHAWMALTILLKTPLRVTDASAVAAYQAYCNEYNGGKDLGSWPQKVLENWRTKGMWETKLPAWASIDFTNPEEVRQVISGLGCLMVEVNLPKPAYTYQMGANFVQFKSPVWKLTGTPDDNVIIGGHEVAVVGYDSRFIYAVTWGVLVRITPAWWNKYVLAANALVVPAIVGRGGFKGLNIDALIADLNTLPA